MENLRRNRIFMIKGSLRFLITAAIIVGGMYLTFLITYEGGVLYNYYFNIWPMINGRFSILYSVSIFCSVLFIALSFVILTGGSNGE